MNKYKFVEFPDPELADPDGLLAVGGNFSIPFLLSAYSQGIFPWTARPITWWSPDPRAIFPVDGLKISRRVQRVIRSGKFKITFNKAFKDVIEMCAKPFPGRGETWISPEFVTGYCDMYENGFAHSIEVWFENRLVGGVYGVALNGFFAGESMFYRESNASTVALFYLFERLKEKGFILFDTQIITPHTKKLGAIEIPRQDYLKILDKAIKADAKF